MTSDSTFGERLRYRLDNFLARGSAPLFVALVIGFLGSLTVLALLRFLLNLIMPDSSHFAYQVWVIFLEMTDPGNMNQDNTTPIVFKLAAAASGLTGVVIFSMLIAFLTTTLDQALGHLRKGHSRVLETNHTLILGWSPRVIDILHELEEANESREDAVAVILADREKEEMDDELRRSFTDRRKTRLVTRSGSIASLRNLQHVNAQYARSAIILASCSSSASLEEKDRSDANVIKAALALQAYAERARPIHIVAEVFGRMNRPIVEEIAPGRSAVVDADDFLAKIIVQTSRTSGLSVVYSELLSFFGCEMYFHRAQWNGARFGDLQYRFPDGIPIGIHKDDGTITIQPDPDAKLAADDEIIIVAQDDSTIQLASSPILKPKSMKPTGDKTERRQERILILGWGAKAQTIVREMADYVLPGSNVDVMFANPPQAIRDEVATLDAAIDELNIRMIPGRPLDRADLNAVEPFTYDTVLVLQQSIADEVDPERADAETLVALLHLRKLVAQAEKSGKKITTKIVTEVLDSANQELINQAGVNDFIISNRLISMIFAQLSEEPRMKDVYENLFAEAGSEIYAKPASLYFSSLPVTCRFVDLMGVAQKRDGEICIGFKLDEHQKDPKKNYGVTLVPDKASTVTIGEHDALVVVAIDER